MSVTPYLYFSGNCAAALAFYEKTIDAVVSMRLTNGEAPVPATPGSEDQIMHASFTVLGSTILGADAPAGAYHKPAGMRVTINLNDTAKAQNWFDGLAEGGAIDMPLQKTFWASAFGMVTDQFGIPWMINCR